MKIKSVWCSSRIFNEPAGFTIELLHPIDYPTSCRVNRVSSTPITQYDTAEEWLQRHWIIRALWSLMRNNT